MRLIDADVLLTEILHDIETSGCVNHERDMLDSIRYAPTIAAEPVRHGRWVYDSGFWTCTICMHDEPCRDEDDPDKPRFKRCPDCGAKMDADHTERGERSGRMDRLTMRIEGEAREDHSRDSGIWKNGSRACMERLAAYEDTGLMPDEVAALRDMNEQLIIAIQDVSNICTDRFRKVGQLTAENERLRTEISGVASFLAAHGVMGYVFQDSTDKPVCAALGKE